MACDGNSTEACGGPNALTLYSANQVKPPSPVVDPRPPGWHSLGCYTDSASRALTVPGASPGGADALTVGLCTLACSQGGYSYAGVEYAGECCKSHFRGGQPRLLTCFSDCGNAISNGNTLAPDGPSSCNMICSGNSSEYCGGPNRINIYQIGAAPVSSTTAKSTTTSSKPSSVCRF